MAPWSHFFSMIMLCVTFCAACTTLRNFVQPNPQPQLQSQLEPETKEAINSMENQYSRLSMQYSCLNMQYSSLNMQYSRHNIPYSHLNYNHKSTTYGLKFGIQSYFNQTSRNLKI